MLASRSFNSGMCRLVLLFGLLLAPLVCLAYGQNPLAGTPGDNSRQLLRVGMIDFAPYSYLDAQGQPAGLYLPLLTRIVENAGYQADFRILPIARLAQGLQDGTVHVWPGIEGKTELIEHTWTSRHILGYLSINLYYHADTPPPIWPDDLLGQSLIMLSGYDYWPSLMTTINDPRNHIAVKRTHSHSGAIGMLERDRARYLLNYHAPMQQALRQRPDLDLRHRTLQWVPLRMIISRQSSMGSQSLLDKLDESYQQLANQGAELMLPAF